MTGARMAGPWIPSASTGTWPLLRDGLGEPEDYALVRSEHEIPWVGAVVAAAQGRWRARPGPPRWDSGLAAQPERYRAGAEVQRHQEPLVAAPVEQNTLRVPAADVHHPSRRYLGIGQPEFLRVAGVGHRRPVERRQPDRGHPERIIRISAALGAGAAGRLSTELGDTERAGTST